MEDSHVCTPHTAEPDDLNNMTSFPNATSVTDRDKVINIKLDSAQVEGDKSEKELLDGLITTSYCHLCCSKLMGEYHRSSHYQGKKHAHKVKTYIKAFREEKTAGCPQAMSNDKNRFCELCNMVFSSDVVAKSHYDGKVHAKNLRKNSLHSPDRNTEVHLPPSLTQYAADCDQKPSPDRNVELRVDAAACPALPSNELDLKDPNKFCRLCSALFNNPQMAMQHYNGRKHQRNQAKQVQEANSLTCEVCGVQTNSVETYHTHMQGSKHQIREKKISDVSKCQPKAYGTFADELADYIQAQKARGITPKTSLGLPQDGMQKKDEDDDEEKQERLGQWDMTGEKSARFNLPHNSNTGTWHPSYLRPSMPPHKWDNPAPFHPCSGSPQFSHWPMKSGRDRRLSSSSTYSTSSSTSYSSSSTDTSSDSDDSVYRHRGKRRIRRSGRDRDRKGGHGESDKKEKGRKRPKRESEYNLEESEDERRRKRLKCHGTKKQKEKKSIQEIFELDREEKQVDSIKKEDTMEAEKETEAHLPAETEQMEGGQGNAAQPKSRKEKKTKGKADTRTEEEKLWDDSILGC
ncbi:zinc finger matrin-type protein 1 isoform X2 [Cololabis saira]|uniref:zinc finger matrin-type protein 1 isoform X2 n=1 Tax=Cololabis saira TaxID=129043 RepID=UPI002AD52497|nr:zinc finger matrin-type protein 1 isoform X2 [Cololabis saira]